MVKFIKQSSISLHFEKDTAHRWIIKANVNEREPGQRHSNKNIKPDRTKDNNIFLKPKDDRTVWRRVDDRLEVGYRELKRFGKTQLKMVEATAAPKISQGKRRNANRGVERAYEELKGNGRRREYHFRSDPRGDQTTPHLHCDLCR